MRFVFFVLALLLAIVPVKGQQGYVPSKENIESRKEFDQARFGIFIHWGIYSMLGDGEWVMHNKNINYKEYERLAGGFYPHKFNAAEWVSVIKSSGAKYICITSRHHDGFSIFHTKASPYNVVDATPFGRDILAEIAADEKQVSTGVDYLKDVRTARGALRDIALNVTNAEQLREEILLDARKDLMNEGQVFFMYKRLNVEKVESSSKPGFYRNMAEGYVLPIPTSESPF